MVDPVSAEVFLPDASGDGHRLAYTQWGLDKANPVLCAHGLTRHGRDFDPLAAVLATDSRVICPDMPGRGESEWFKDTTLYNYAVYLQDLLGLLNHLGIARCQWVGTSMGGILGMMMAALYPERVSALVLNDIGAIVAKEGLKRIAEYTGKNIAFPTRDLAETSLRQNLSTFGIRDESEWQHVFAYSIRAENDGSVRLHYDPQILSGYAKETQNFSAIEDIDLHALWQAVACPVLVLRGEHSDVLRAETLVEMQGKQRVETWVVPCVGHAPSLFGFEQIQTVTEWLRRNR